MFDRLQYKFIGKDIAGRFAAVMMPVSFLILLLTGGFISENIHFQSADTIVYNLGSGWYYGRWMARVRILWINIEIPMLFFLLLGIGLIIMGIVGVILQYGEKAFYMYAQKYVPGIDPEPSTRLVFSYSAANAGKFFTVELIMWVKIILWSLLFIVPGIIKYYQYRLIPYLIASDPALSYSEAQQRWNSLSWIFPSLAGPSLTLLPHTSSALYGFAPTRNRPMRPSLSISRATDIHARTTILILHN